MTTTKTRPWLSGFCNASNPEDSHRRCDEHPRVDGVPCSCFCHMAPDKVPVEQIVGFHDNIPEDAYHAHVGSLSHSGAKVLLKAPALFDYQRQHPVFKNTFDFGSAAHALVLGAGLDSIYVAPFDNWMTKQAKVERDEAHRVGMAPILPKDWAVVCDMADQLSSHRKAMELLSIGDPEVSAFAVDDETGVLMRCRYDWRRPRIGVDYKTTTEGGADPDEFVRTAAKLGYHSQQDWYSHVAEILGEPLQGFGFIVQEKEPPYLVTVVELPSELVDLGRDRNRRARQMFRDCTDAGIWPGYYPDDQIATPDAPDWILRKATAS